MAIAYPVEETRVGASIERIHFRNGTSKPSSVWRSAGVVIWMWRCTPVSPRGYDVALLAVSAWLDGVEQVLSR